MVQVVQVIGTGERARALRTAFLCLILCHHTTMTSEPELAFAMHEIGSLHGITTMTMISLYLPRTPHGIHLTKP